MHNVESVEKRNEVLRLLEEAADRGARQGLLAEDMVQGMLTIYVGSKLFGASAPIESVLAEVKKKAEELLETPPDESNTEVGPPLGTENRHIACVTKLTLEKAEKIREWRQKGFTRRRIAETCHAEWQGDWGPPWSPFIGGQLVLEASERLGEAPGPWNAAAAANEALEQRVYERVAEIFSTDRGVDSWLRTPHSGLGGKSPIAVVYEGTPGAFKRINGLLPTRLGRTRR